MSGSTNSQPSWQSLQRRGGAPSSASSPPPSLPQSRSTYEGQGQQPQAFPVSQSRARPSTATSNYPSNSSLTGATSPPVSMNRSTSYGDQLNGAGSDEREAQTQPAPQQPVHRRAQSLRPMSAFQPMEHVENGYEAGNRDGGNGQRPSSPTGSTTRSIRTAAAPLTFKSPELRSALGLQDAQSKKIYMEGYLSRRDHLNPDGKPLNATDAKKRWHLCFVQLSGTVLSVWGVQQMEEAARQGTEVPPSYINITDCFVDFIGTITETPQEVPGTRGRYENVFAINTAGQNRILFGVEGAVGRRLVQAWVNGIRLASWEKIRLEEIYTGSLVRARLGAVSAQQATSGPGGAPGDVEMAIKSPLSKTGRMEGWVKARFMGSTEWKSYWLVLSDKGAEGAAISSDTASVTSPNPRNSFWSKLRAGDRSSLIGSPSTPSLADTGLSSAEVPPGGNGAPGLACFYESKKAKKPFATLAYAAHAFAVYPSRPELVEGSSLFKVEGAFPLSKTISATNRNRQTGWVMIMPELEGQGKGANAEMMKWCIAFMDAFRLYGRPTQFQWDARSPVSPFFAYPIGSYKDRLFLDRELAEFLDIREERHLANRNNLHGIMSARMRGERTPILPPLPQPNAESTRNLNGPQEEEQQRQGTGNGAKSAALSALPPLNFGQKEPSSSSSSLSAVGRPPPNSSGDASLVSRGGLDSIGERSREGSVMTTLNTPITPVGANPALDHITQLDSKQGSMYSQSSGVEDLATPASAGGSEVVAAAVRAGSGHPNQAQRSSSISGKGPGSEGSTKLPHLGPNTPTPGTTTANPVASSSSSFQSVKQGPQEAAMPVAPPQSRQAEATAPIAIPPTLNQRTLQASGRGAEAEANQTANDGTVVRKNSDPYGSYDESTLYYMNSMADQLPAVSQQGPTKVQGRESSGGVAATHAPQQASGLSQSGSMSEHSTAYNHRAQAKQSSTTSSGPSQAARPISTQTGDIDQDAMAAYSFLDQPPSPNVPMKPEATRVPAINEPAQTGSGPQAYTQAYPSTFGGNKKAQERKMAAQAQAQAHQDALAKPGRPGGGKKGLKQAGGQRHAWADEESEEDDEEEEEEEEEVQRSANLATNDTAVPARYSPNGQAQVAAANVPPQLYNQRTGQRSVSPQTQAQYSQQGGQGMGTRQSMFNQHLGAGHEDQRGGTQSSPSTSTDAPQRNTFVQLGQEDQPGAMTTAFQPHGLLQAGAQDKAERSAKQQEAQARAEGTHMVTVDSKPPPPQAGLLGAISAHERDRKKEGGLGATLTERERERVQAERRQREEEMMRMQQQQQQQQMMAGGQSPGWGGGMPFNPMMWQQMQMMQMMNPQMMMNPMMAAQQSGSQLGHGGGHGSGSISPDSFAAQQQAQMMAAQAAQQAYMQAMSQHGGSMIGGEGGGAMPPSSMGMMPFNPYMSMYGSGPPHMPPFQGWMSAPGSETGGPRMSSSPSAGLSPNSQNRSQERLNANGSPLRR